MSPSWPPPGEITEEVIPLETTLTDAALPLSTTSEVDACVACGAVHANDGDGYCKACGHRLGSGTEFSSSQVDSSEEAPTTSLRPGLRVGAYTVLGPAARDDARATTPDGREVLVILGSPSALAVETEALQKLH
ncbi:MAG: hypothetical protein ACMG6S_35540, partial [Byssovorax sp.]